MDYRCQTASPLVVSLLMYNKRSAFYESGILRRSCQQEILSGDNASMIAYASFVDPDGTWLNINQELSFNASLRLEDLPS